MEAPYIIIYFLIILEIILIVAFLLSREEINQLKKQLNRPKPKMMFTEIDPNKFIEMIMGKSNINDNPEFNERKYLIEELTRLNAKGWSEESTIEELRNLYDLLQ